jgi:hypothetical protein
MRKALETLLAQPRQEPLKAALTKTAVALASDASTYVEAREKADNF